MRAIFPPSSGQDWTQRSGPGAGLAGRRAGDAEPAVKEELAYHALTGGYVLAGFHEVFYTEATKRVRDNNIQITQEQGIRKSTWRISSTLFSHLRYNVNIEPMEELSHLVDI